MTWLQDLLRSVYEMSPLEEQVVDLGVCSKCHKKKLRPVLNGNGYRWQQCTNCLTCFVDDERVSSSTTRPQEGK